MSLATELALIITAKDQATGVIRRLKGEVSSANRDMAASLEGLASGAGKAGDAIGLALGAIAAGGPQAALIMVGIEGAMRRLMRPFTLLGQIGRWVFNGIKWGAEVAIQALARTARVLWDLGTGAVRVSLVWVRRLGLAVAGLTAGLGLLVRNAVQAAASMEQSRIAYASLLHSVEAGQRAVQQLQDFARETPFQFADLLRLGKLVLAYGFAWQEVIPVLRMVGDATSSLGGGADIIERLLRAIGQIRGKGKLAMQELYQIAETGIPVFDILSEKLGLTREQISNIGEVGIPASTALAALFAGLQERFGGAMAAQMRTVAGQFSNLEDILFALKVRVGEVFLPLVRESLAALVDRMERLGPVLQNAARQAVAFFQSFRQSPLVTEIAGRLRQLFETLAGAARGESGWAVFQRLVMRGAQAVNFLLVVIQRLVAWLQWLAAAGVFRRIGAEIAALPTRILGGLQWLREKVPTFLGEVLAALAGFARSAVRILSNMGAAVIAVGAAFISMARSFAYFSAVLAFMKGQIGMGRLLLGLAKDLGGAAAQLGQLEGWLREGLPAAMEPGLRAAERFAGTLRAAGEAAARQPWRLPPAPPLPPAAAQAEEAPPPAPVQIPPPRQAARSPQVWLPPRPHQYGVVPPGPSRLGAPPPEPEGEPEAGPQAETAPKIQVSVYIGDEKLDERICRVIAETQRAARYVGAA